MGLPTVVDIASLPDIKLGYHGVEVLFDNDPHNIKLRVLKLELKESESVDQLFARKESKIPALTLWLIECTDHSTRQYLSNEFLRPTACSVYFYDMKGNVVDSRHMRVVGKVSHLVQNECDTPHPYVMYRCEYVEVE